TQATWWTEYARLLGMRYDTRGTAAARHAVELWATQQQPHRTLFANVVWVRQINEPGEDLDRAWAELQARAAALDDLNPLQRLQVHSALTAAALIREDHAAVLRGRLREVELAREAGHQNAVEAAESNIVIALNALQRYREAAERGRELLAGIDRAGGGDANGNIPWVMSGLFLALVR